MGWGPQMNKKVLTETDIRSKFITPAILGQVFLLNSLYCPSCMEVVDFGGRGPLVGHRAPRADREECTKLFRLLLRMNDQARACSRRLTHVWRQRKCTCQLRPR